MILADEVKAVVSLGKAPHAEGIELDDADILNRFAFKLRGDLPMFILEEWHVVCKAAV